MTIFHTRMRPGDERADCIFWGLTSRECLDHCIRISKYKLSVSSARAQKSREDADRAMKQGFWIMIGLLIAYAVGVPLVTHLICADIGCR